MTLFEERERAAEYGFSHAEELRFLATRAGVEALASWCAEALHVSDMARDAYVQDAVSRFVAGESEQALVASVRADLERLGKTDFAHDAEKVFLAAVAAASDRLHGRQKMSAAPTQEGQTEHHLNAFWGWTV